MRYDVDMIRERLKIEEVLTGAGGRLRNGRGPCPLCNTSESSTAFSVRGNRWRCFACGEHGDVIELLAKLEGQEWVEAIPRAAKLAGVEPGQRIFVKEKREDPRIFRSESFRRIVALRDALCDIYSDPSLGAETRATALWSAWECEDTLDFICEEAP